VHGESSGWRYLVVRQRLQQQCPGWLLVLSSVSSCQQGLQQQGLASWRLNLYTVRAATECSGCFSSLVGSSVCSSSAVYALWMV
jgi:hypothetical protein